MKTKNKKLEKVVQNEIINIRKMSAGKINEIITLAQTTGTNAQLWNDVRLRDLFRAPVRFAI